jgi:hypothetical protein
MNKKVWLALGMGALCISLESSVEKDDGGSSFLYSLVGSSLVREMDRASDSDSLNMSWSDPRVTAMEKRLELLEDNQIQQDVVMQSQDARMKELADEIEELKKKAATQKVLLLAKVESVQSSLAAMLTQKVVEIHAKSVEVENSIRAIQNSLVLQRTRIRKLSAQDSFGRVGSGKVKFGSSAGKKQGKKKK